MTDRYWRKIEDVENDIENAMQISSILLKLKGYDDKLGDLKKIGNNESNISSNLGKINTNINTIKLINKNFQDNSTDISSNLGKIATNEGNISSNLGKITTNEGNILSNLGKIDTNESNILFNLGKITTNKNNIDEINENLSNIDFNSNNKYSIENFFIYNIGIENNYTLNKDTPNFSVFKYTLEDNFKKDSILEINCKLLYDYTTYNNIGALMHVFKLYDDNNNLLHEYNNLKSNAGDNHKDDLTQIDLFYVKLNNDYYTIKIELILSLLDNVTKSVTCKLYNSLKSNFLCIKHYKRINLISVNNNLGELKNIILSNKNDISANLIKINSNEDEITYIKNNISKPYLKNIYNILIYESKTQIDFTGIFFEKVFDVNANKNDFLEMNFKIDLEYEDISERNYIKTIYELFDGNGNSLYIKSVSNNEYLYFSNRVIIDDNIFYNFITNVNKIKFVIKFQNISFSRVIKIFYIKNDNYRLTIKNYGL